MIKNKVLLLLSLLLFCAEKSFADHQQIPVDVFAKASSYKAVSLSPDESRYFIISLKGSEHLIQISSNPYKQSSSQQEYILPTSLFAGVSWISDHQILVAYTLINKNKKGRINNYVREWVLIDTQDKSLKTFLTYEVNLLIANQQAELLHVLPDEPDNILIAYPEKKRIYPAIFKVNIHTGETEKILDAQKPITSWLVDKDGKALMGYGSSSGEIKLLIRNKDDDLLEDISEKPLFKTGYFTPLKQGLTDTTMFVSSSIGQGRKKIYHYDYIKHSILSKVYEHPIVDVDSISYSYKKNKILAASYIEDSLKYFFFDKNFEDLYGKITQKVPDKNIRIINYNEENDFFIIASSNENSPVDFHIYNKQNDELKMLASNSEKIKNYDLAPVEAVTYFSRDGLEIHSYLTKPMEGNGPAPAIVMPHGGPWVRDTLIYNDWAQFFANRGYVVLQPNFRGSTGYGSVFTNLSYGEWGGKMQDDLTDGVKWLVRNKIADPDKICIVGGSYGGYAALMGIIKDPDLYQCAISFAPVTDLSIYLNTYKSFPDNEVLKTRVMGNNPKSFLKEKSPSELAKKIKVPVLIAHGNSDIRVNIKHSELMVRSLKKAKKSFEYIELDDGSHFLLQANHKKILFEKMEKFLSENILE